jgi:hypothetical protein
MFIGQSCHSWNPRYLQEEVIQEEKVKGGKIEPEQDKMELGKPVSVVLV